MTYKTLDITSDPASQGYQPHSYDLVVACNVLHATPEIMQTMANVRILLKSGGRLLLIEETTGQPRHFPFTALPGWWLSQDATRMDGPLLDVAGWNDVMKARGFSGVDLKLYDFPDAPTRCGCLMLSTANATQMLEGQTEVVIVDDDIHDGPNLSERLVKGIQDLIGVSPTTTALSEANVAGKWCNFPCWHEPAHSGAVREGLVRDHTKIYC
jgi:SAM-dependent methyltransferase